MPFECVRLFFACDRKYLPLLGVALASIKTNRNPARAYEACVLHTELKEKDQARLRAVEEEGFSLSFCDVTAQISHLSDRLHTRDYYSKATYYRLFIPTLFPHLDKALYLDSDIILRTDVGALYDTPLADCLVGAVPDGFVNFVPILRKYVENRVGVPKDVPYFNAGVLLMNLAEMRRVRFEERFLALLDAVAFRVAQDQDYLNVICRERVRFLSDAWNHMPFRVREEEPYLVHFNLDSKPWQKDGVLYAEEFWRYADASPFGDAVRAMRAAYTEQMRAEAAKTTEDLIALAVAQSEDASENEKVKERIVRALCEMEGASL